MIPKLIKLKIASLVQLVAKEAACLGGSTLTHLNHSAVLKI